MRRASSTSGTSTTARPGSTSRSSPARRRRSSPARTKARPAAGVTSVSRVNTVLFTCSGMRVDAVTAFQQAGATTIAADADPLAPTLHHADERVLVPRVDDPAYIPALAEIVRDRDVGLVIPVTDIDSVQLAQRRDELGAPLLLPDTDIVVKTADKYEAHNLFEQHGIPSPPSWLQI